MVCAKATSIGIRQEVSRLPKVPQDQRNFPHIFILLSCTNTLVLRLPNTVFVLSSREGKTYFSYYENNNLLLTWFLFEFIVRIQICELWEFFQSVIILKKSFNIFIKVNVSKINKTWNVVLIKEGKLFYLSHTILKLFFVTLIIPTVFTKLLYYYSFESGQLTNFSIDKYL